MTFSELLHSVIFYDLVPLIKKYHGGDGSMANYKMHYDILCHMTPQLDEEDAEEDENYDKVIISNGEIDPFMPEPHLDAYPIEGCGWENALGKIIALEPDVNASNEEIAACCLWHTSFYGFTKDDREETWERLDYYGQNLLDHDIDRIEAKKIIEKMESLGVRVPSKKEMLKVPSFHAKVKKEMRIPRLRQKKNRKWFGSTWRRIARKTVQFEYYKYIRYIAPIVINSLDKGAHPNDEFSARGLSKLFTKNNIIVYSFRSYSYDASKRAQWMMELIESFNAFRGGTHPNYIMSLGHHSNYPLTPDDFQLNFYMSNRFNGTEKYFSHHVDDNLDQDLSLSIAFFE